MTLTRHDGKNIGSIRKLWIKLKEEITDTNSPADTVTDGLGISEDISMIGVWTPLEIIIGEASWQEIGNDDGTYTFSIQANLHRDRQSVTESLHNFDKRQIMVIAQDRNDQDNRLLGEAGIFDYHANLKYSQVKEKSPGRNSYDITITCTMHHPACYYTGAIDE